MKLQNNFEKIEPLHWKMQQVFQDFQKNILLKGSGHRSIFETSIWVWKMRPLTGFGLKSFRIKCWDVLTMIKNPKVTDRMLVKYVMIYE